MRHIIAPHATHVVLYVFAALALVGCPDNKSSEETGPASGGTSGDPATGDAGTEPEPVRPEAMPMLCTLDAGKWCGAPCPQGDAGPLCCTGEVCAPWDAAGPACDGAVAWCNNYTLSDDAKIAACHDEI